MEIAKVEPITTARALRGPFDYRLPASMSDVGVGSLLMVPFGGRRRMLGVVVGLADSSELAPDRLAEPIEALGAGATPELVDLGLWVAERYCSTPSRGLALVLPPGSGTGVPRAVSARTERRAQITAAGREALAGEVRLGERQRAALESPGGRRGALRLRSRSPRRRRLRRPRPARGAGVRLAVRGQRSGAARASTRSAQAAAGSSSPRSSRPA